MANVFNRKAVKTLSPVRDLDRRVVVGSGIIKGRISFGEVVFHHPLPQLSYILSGPRQMIFVKLDDAYQ